MVKSGSWLPGKLHYYRRDAKAKVTVWASAEMVQSMDQGNAYLNTLNENVIPQMTENFNHQVQDGHFLRV